nr:ribosomal protein S18-alanine N-acetyltransferase [Halanaerobacter jeridensis]
MEEVSKIEAEAFPSPWSNKTFLKELNNPFALYLVGGLEDEIVVYIGCWLLDEQIHITTLATKMEYRKNGLATEILHNLLARAKEMGKEKASLEVRISNKKAQQMYIKEGFFKIAKKRSYYKDNGEDAIVMWKQL